MFVAVTGLALGAFVFTGTILFVLDACSFCAFAQIVLFFLFIHLLNKSSLSLVVSLLYLGLLKSFHLTPLSVLLSSFGLFINFFALDWMFSSLFFPRRVMNIFRLPRFIPKFWRYFERVF